MARSIIHWGSRFPQPSIDFHTDFENLMNHFFGPGKVAQSDSNSFLLGVNVSETENQYEISAELPGVAPQDVNIEFHDGVLTISGQKEGEKELEGKTHHRVERSYGEFQRSFRLAKEIDHENIVAQFEHGVLKISLPKSEKEKPKKIEIKVSK